jgi:hypothetical protein
MYDMLSALKLETTEKRTGVNTQNFKVDAPVDVDY